jgi:hypothetical protein
MILFTLLFSLYEYMGGTETFTQDFYNSCVDGSLMIWFPVGRSYSSMVLFFLLRCCYCFLSLSLSRHSHKFSFVVDLRQIEFDWIIETITTIITKNWTFLSFSISFCIRQNIGFLHMDVCFIGVLASTPSGLKIVVKLVHTIYNWHSTRIERPNNLSLMGLLEFDFALHFFSCL